MSTVKPKHMLNKQLDALLEGETNRIANLSNASALLFEQLSEINWAGFYLWEDSENELVLGPFQGKVACVRIENGSGVCGTAFKEQKTYLVKDVHEFPGHIACDAASESEIVVPLTKDGIQIGVLDIDAPIKNRFTEEDQEIIEEFASVLLKHL
ncbi:histidine kinase [Marinilactibacillus sp. 15R]|uniref:GAF domain-containing protein n=1 Tax=Marinilactibacillus sp. 15R TaxID=1911586 RepID=UPI00090B9EF2|nr:GAF domain-containing protein [Marinilactibacillus sp. 15R]API89170.1 histidine kinase [Marinilactibacillus sp. 15R]